MGSPAKGVFDPGRSASVCTKVLAEHSIARALLSTLLERTFASLPLPRSDAPKATLLGTSWSLLCPSG